MRLNDFKFFKQKCFNMKKLSLLLFMFLFVLGTSWAQRTVSGTVTDDSGAPLIGANVLVKGTNIGTVTDLDGKYMIDVPEGANALIFSYTGFSTKEMTLGAGNVYNLTLSEGVTLADVVVTALGIKRDEKALGYATQLVDGGVLNEAPEINVVNSLNGRVSGVNITNSSGAVGSSSRIILRGASTIFGNNQPLFVVDGVPISNDNTGSSDGNGGFDIPNGVADLNSSDIESINVLKGPNAAALYGVRAANGVVVIVTKKGRKSNAIGVELTSSVTFENPLVIPSYQNSYGQGSSNSYFEYINGTAGDGGVDESWGPPLDVGLEFMQFSSFINNPDNPQPEPWVSHPNNVRDFYDTGLTFNNNLSFSGGNDAGNFRIGMGYLDQKGMVPFTDFQKLSFTGAGSYNLSKRLTANLTVNFIKSYSDNLPSSGYDGANVVQQTIWAGRQVDFTLLKDWRNIPTALPGSSFGAGIVPTNWNTQFQNNPYWQLENNRNDFDRNRTIGRMGLEYRITDHLSAAANIGLDNYTTKTTTRFAKGTAADAPTYWRFGGDGNRDGSQGYYDEDLRTFIETNMDFSISYNNDITDMFGLGVTFGGNRMARETSWDFRGIQIELPGLYNLGNVLAGSTPFSNSTHGKSAINSLYGQAELSFNRWLYLNVTGRNDWASVLPLENNSFFYPSVTLSAVLSEGLGLESETLNYLKVRAGWAEVGGFGPLASGDILPVYNLSSAPWNGIVFGEFPTTLNNSQIKPQTTTGLEGGLELRMFKDKIRFDATYYDQTTFDLILPVQVSRSSGVSFVWDNVGELRNRGVELQLGATVFERNDFAINLDFNWAKNNNEVISAGKDDENDNETLILGTTWNMNLEAREGQPYGVIFGSSLERDDDGNVVFANGLPLVGDQKILGNIQPDWAGGVNLAISYKGLSFNGLVDAKMGGELYSMTSAWGRYSGILEETMQGRETGIVGNGVMLDSEGNYVPNNVVVSAENFNHNAYGNDIVETSVFDASYVKLRQLALSYSFPKSWLKGASIEGLSLSLIGRNLAILYKKAPHIDPETGYDNSNGNQGQEFGQLPSARSYGASLNIKF